MGPASLPPAVLSASEELNRRCERYEVFARIGTTSETRIPGSGPWEHRVNREVGVACRAVRAGTVSFAAASGGGARSGRDAARACLATLAPGPDPLPPTRLLGLTQVPPAVASGSPEEVDVFASRVAAAAAAHAQSVTLLDLRVIGAGAETVLVREQGYVGQARSAAVVVELLLSAPVGPARLFHVAATSFAVLDPAQLVESAVETVLLLARGCTVKPRLADAVAAPAVAAELVGALGRELVAARLSRARLLLGAHVSPAWRLEDKRAGPTGLLPFPFDGEGLPSQNVLLLADGHRHEPPLAWHEASLHRATPGGAVRPSYRTPPASGLANLVVAPGSIRSATELVAGLDDGLYLALPHGPARSDPGSGRFSLQVGAVTIRAGRAVAAHPVVEVRGSFRRLLASLETRAADVASFAQSGAVTTPALLLRRLEVG